MRWFLSAIPFLIFMIFIAGGVFYVIALIALVF
jgi:hypothetical protein